MKLPAMAGRQSRLVRNALLAVALVSAACSWHDLPESAARDAGYDISELEAIAKRFVDDEWASGIAVAFVRGDRIEIRGYGIQAYSSGLSFGIDLRIELVDRGDGDTVWRRRVSDTEKLTPELFGVSSAVGNVVTAVALSKLTEEEMVSGFGRLADGAAGHVIRRLEDDVLSARYRVAGRYR